MQVWVGHRNVRGNQTDEQKESFGKYEL